MKKMFLDYKRMLKRELNLKMKSKFIWNSKNFQLFEPPGVTKQ